MPFFRTDNPVDCIACGRNRRDVPEDLASEQTQFMCDPCFVLVLARTRHHIVGTDQRNMKCLCGRLVDSLPQYDNEYDALLEWCSFGEEMITSDEGRVVMGWKTDCCRRPFFIYRFRREGEEEKYALYTQIALMDAIREVWAERNGEGG
jgi:hypothetical protein